LDVRLEPRVKKHDFAAISRLLRDKWLKGVSDNLKVLVEARL
jgi:hypothetical protein